MSKQRNIRKRRAVDDDDEISNGGNEDTQKPLTAEEIRFLQKQRQRKTVRLTSVFDYIFITAFPLIHDHPPCDGAFRHKLLISFPLLYTGRWGRDPCRR